MLKSSWWHRLHQMIPSSKTREEMKPKDPHFLEISISLSLESLVSKEILGYHFQDTLVWEVL